jgi:hypothetical protein
MSISHDIHPMSPFEVQLTVTYVLWSSQSNTGDTRDLGKTKLANQLSRLLLIARVHDGSTSGDALTTLDVRIRIIRSILLCGDILGDGLVIWEFFDAWVRHVGGSCSRGQLATGDIQFWNFQVVVCAPCLELANAAL